jgi:CheY-like chemotaxis protein
MNDRAAGHMPRAAGRRRRVLVAEDDPEMRRVLVDVLNGEGYEAHAVGDGAALLTELASSNRFHWDSVDLVIADVRMPLCDGLRAAETMRALRPRVPFLLVTGFPDEATYHRANALAVVLLEKPFSIGRLTEAAAQALARAPVR